MNWGNFNMHIGNLFPGLISVVLILYRFPNLFNNCKINHLQQIISNDFIASSVFIATSYIVGIFAVTMSRLIIDILSQYTTRPLILKLYSWSELKGKSCQYINNDFRQKLQKVLSSDNDTIINEVLQRRERGRLLRSTFIPLILTIIFFSKTSLFELILYLFISLLVFVLLDSYAANSIYAECKLLNKEEPS